MNTSLSKLTKKLICVTIGDIEGIGVYLLLKEFKKQNIKDFILITNINIFLKYIKFPKSKINIINENFNNYNNKKLNIYTYRTKNSRTNTMDALNYAYELTKKSFFIGILTLPLNKFKINKSVNKNFIDQTTFFSNKENQKYSNMIFYHKNKIFIPLTIHIELKEVHKSFKNKFMMTKKIENLYSTLINDFNIKKPKMILSGINPHAGENKIISIDDSKYLLPILTNLKQKGIFVHGPISGDGIINRENLKKYDAFIFTYHDQALIPFKILSDYEGINFTSNLDIIRVSPSHGTAEHLIESNKVRSKGIINCFKLIKKIKKNRN